MELSKSDFATTRKYAEYIDLNSFVDWWLVYELAGNAEVQPPRAVTCTKTNRRNYTGPAWDFDWGTFRPESRSSFLVKNAIWYCSLFNDPAFVQLVKSRWALLKPKFETVDAFIAAEAELINISDSVNATMWPICQNTNGDEFMSFDDAIERMRSAYRAKLQWLDRARSGNCNACSMTAVVSLVYFKKTWTRTIRLKTGTTY